MKKFYLFLLVLSVSISSYAEWKTITNGSIWHDTDGDIVQAHGAGFLKVGDTWYMVGEDRTDKSEYINLYSSKDLISWKFENSIVSPETCDALKNGTRFIERPKIIYNEKTKKYVVWCHWEGTNYAPAEAGVFYCDQINGNYTYHKGFRPFDKMSRDDGLFVDDDGTAYFYSAGDNNATLYVYRLTEDYLDVDEIVNTLFVDKFREAPVMLKKDGIYFIVSSGCTGWKPNQTQYSYATSIGGTWSDLINIGGTSNVSDHGQNIAFDTQPTYILEITGTEETTYVFCGDRWQDPYLPESKTILFPIEFEGTSITMNYQRQWDLDVATGKWRITPRNNFIDKTNWTLHAVSSEQASSEGAANAFDNDLSTIWHTQYEGSAPGYPHYITVDMGEVHENITGFLCRPRMDNGPNGIIRDYQLYVSLDGESWGEPVAGGWMSWDTEVCFEPVTARYFRLTALSGWYIDDTRVTPYASVAEIEMIQGTTCAPQPLSLKYTDSSTDIAIWQKNQPKCLYPICAKCLFLSELQK